MADLAIILTVRRQSERLPNKVLTTVGKRSLLYWIIKRLKTIPDSQVVVATTRNREDDKIVKAAEALGVPVFRGSQNNVIERVDKAWKKYVPEMKLIMRALGDCPFISANIIERAKDVLLKWDRKEAIVWHLPPEKWPVYGAREFPYSKAGWYKIARNATTRQELEHPDVWFHNNRRRFNILYHESPKQIYFRDYRLEVDFPEDIKLIRRIHKEIGITSSLPNVIKLLDRNQDIARINRERVEKTGPLTTYHFQQRRYWMYAMTGKPFLQWDGKWYEPFSREGAKPIWCKCGRICLGFAQGGSLYTVGGEVIEQGKTKCRDCGIVRVWDRAVERKI
jgi:spore coat polysaccharide biosynthesis protein SpsF